MLIRFVIENLFSFGESKEFTTIPKKRLKTFQEHKYNYDGFEILKLSSIYGANGAGKSNLIKSLFQFQKDQILAVEFIQDNIPLYYAVVLSGDKISKEELYVSGLGKKNDKLIFERKTSDKETTIQFLDDFENDEKSKVLKAVLLEEFVKPNEPVLKLLSNRDNKFLKDDNTPVKFNRDLPIGII